MPDPGGEKKGSPMRTGAHVREEMLVDYADGRLDPLAVERVAAHLEGGCVACSRRLQEVRRQLAALAVYRAPAVPASLHAQLVGIIDGVTPQHSFLERLVASLRFDSRVQPAFAGVRAAEGMDAAVQLLYETGSVAVELWCEREAGTWQITGQAMTRTAGEGPWKVVARGAGGEAEADTDATGMFDFQGLRPGTYDLLLRDQQREIVLPDIRLAPA
jgi:hypothetical protein